MKLGDYKRAMRPKKYLNSNFIVYDGATAGLADELTPGPLKDELTKDFDPSQETYEEYLQRKALEDDRVRLAIGGGVIKGEDLGTREGFYEPQLVDHPKGKYMVKFPYKGDYGNPRFRGIQYGTEDEIKKLIKDRTIAADKSYKEGVAKAAQVAKEKAEADIKATIDSFIEKGDYENFRSKPYESQLKRKLPSGQLRQSAGGRVKPKTFQYIRDMLDAGDYENLSRITGRSKEELISFSKKLPERGSVDIKLRAKRAGESNPRLLTNEQRRERGRATYAKRAESEAKAKKYASSQDLEDFSKINKQKKRLNNFFAENPNAINDTDFGKEIKKLMDIRLNKEGNLVYNTRPDSYYVEKAKNKDIFDVFDVSPIKSKKQSTRFPVNLNITPKQFNGAFIEGQVDKYFKKGGRFEGNQEILNKVSNFLDQQGVRVELTDVGRIGAPPGVGVDRTTGKFPNIYNTLKKLKIPNDLLTDINPILKPGQKGSVSGALLTDLAKLPVGVLSALDMPLIQVLFASQFDPKTDMALNVTLPAMFTDEAARFLNLYGKSAGNFSKFMKLAARAGVPRNIAKKVFPLISKGGTIGTVAAPLLELGRQAYLEKERRDQLPDLARQFNLPREEIEKGYDSYVRGTLPETLAGQGLDYLEVPESPGLEGIKRGAQEFASIIGMAEDPYAQNYQAPYPMQLQRLYDKQDYQAPNPMILERLYERQGFKKGGMSRRGFLKLLTLIPAGIAGLTSLRLGPAKTKKVLETAKGAPEWFGSLVDKVIRLGEDVTKKVATLDRQTVHRYKLDEDEYIDVTQYLDTGDVKVSYNSPNNMGGESVELNYTAPEMLEEGVRVPADFRAIESEPRGIRMGPDDYDIEFDGENIVENVDELMSDTTRLKQFATEKIDPKDLDIRSEKLKKVRDLNEDQVSQAEYLETKYGPADEGSPYYQDFSDYD